jgi:hypothetical protein
MQFYSVYYYRNRLKSKRQYFYIFLKALTWEIYKKCSQAQKLKMADESNKAAKTFFSDENFKNDISSKKYFFAVFSD